MQKEFIIVINWLIEQPRSPIDRIIDFVFIGRQISAVAWELGLGQVLDNQLVGTAIEVQCSATVAESCICSSHQEIKHCEPAHELHISATARFMMRFTHFTSRVKPTTHLRTCSTTSSLQSITSRIHHRLQRTHNVSACQSTKRDSAPRGTQIGALSRRETGAFALLASIAALTASAAPVQAAGRELPKGM